MSDELRLEYVDLDKIQIMDGNPKDHDIGAIHESISALGYRDPVEADETQSTADRVVLVAGAGRIEALNRLRDANGRPPAYIKVDEHGHWLVPVVRGGRFGSVTDARRYVIGNNRVNELGGWNEQQLADWLQEIAREEGTDGLAGTGYDGDDLDSLLSLVALEAGSQMEDVDLSELGSAPEPPSYTINIVCETADEQARVAAYLGVKIEKARKNYPFKEVEPAILAREGGAGR